MILSFFDDNKISDLYPLTLTRPAADLRCGIFTIAEKWKRDLRASDFGFESAAYLNSKFSAVVNPHFRINGRLLPNPALLAAIQRMQAGNKLVYQGTLIAEMPGENATETEIGFEVTWIQRPFDIFRLLQQEIPLDLVRMDGDIQPQTASETNRIFGSYPVYIDSGAKVECAVLNATTGPIYIGKNCEVMEGSLIRGPFAMMEGSVIKLGAKVYGATALGPYSVIGGEVNNIQVQGYSNKGHDGFLGNAVIGEWCNIGADTNCSNLKNTYDEVKVWNYSSGKFEKSGQQFCGLIMGDHSKCGINTMFNTGTVVGVAANIFGSGFPRQFIPDFAWGGASGFTTYKLDAAFKTAAMVMPRRKKEFDKSEEEILSEVFENTKGWRNWE
ncbi:MAG: glucose-1-phosphate thymidylyltransferase [Bacteroidetes bacterium]|nr:glucose-1-phosphate thymidylyltransferase [Bacteroidota bacterium]